MLSVCYQKFRNLFHSLTKDRSVKPGGWVEFQDWNSHPYSNDGSTEGTWLKQYQELVIDAFEKAGYEANPGPKLEEWFRDAGFKNIRVKKFVVPYGTWPKDRHFVSFAM